MLRRSLWLLACAMFVFVLAGCNHQLPKSPPTYSSSTYFGPKVLFVPSDATDETKRVKCPVSAAPAKSDLPETAAKIAKEESGAAAVLGWLIDKGTDLIEKYLENRAKEYAASSTAKNVVMLLDQPSTYRGCLVYVYGTFGKVDEDKRGGGGVWPNATLENLGLIGRPEQYIEFWVYHPDAKREHLVVQPVLLDYAATRAKRISGNSKDVVINVSLDAVRAGTSKQAASKETLVTTAFAYTNLPIGARLEKPALIGVNIEAQPLKMEDAKKPLNASITVAEGEEFGDMLLKIANALKKNDDKIDEKLGAGVKKLLGLDK